jgi:hypothetical protein
MSDTTKRPLPYDTRCLEVAARCLNPAYPNLERPWYESRWHIARGYTDERGTFELILRQEGWVGAIEYTLFADLTRAQKKHYDWGRDTQPAGPWNAITGSSNWHEDPALRGDEKLARRTARAHSDAEFLARCAADPELLALHRHGPRPVHLNANGQPYFAARETARA